MAGLLVLAFLPLVRRTPPQWSIWLAAIALTKFFVPPVIMSPAALLDDLAYRLRPRFDLRELEYAVIVLLFVVYARDGRGCHLCAGAPGCSVGVRARRRSEPGSLADLSALVARFGLARLPCSSSGRASRRRNSARRNFREAGQPGVCDN